MFEGQLVRGRGVAQESSMVLRRCGLRARAEGRQQPISSSNGIAERAV